MQRHSRQRTFWLMLCLPFVLSSCLGECSAPAAPQWHVELQSELAQVQYQPPGRQPETLHQAESRTLDVGDGVGVNKNGRALLDFPCLLVYLYRDTNVDQLEVANAEVKESGPPLLCGYLLVEGTTLNATKAEQEAGRLVDVVVSTQWATIKALGTQFQVAYDPRTETTSVTVVQGAVEVTTSAGTTRLGAGEYERFVRDQPVHPPISALCRGNTGIGPTLILREVPVEQSAPVFELPTSTAVVILGRDEAASYFFVAALEGAGWIPGATLVCDAADLVLPVINPNGARVNAGRVVPIFTAGHPAQVVRAATDTPVPQSAKDTPIPAVLPTDTPLQPLLPTDIQMPPTTPTDTPIPPPMPTDTPFPISAYLKLDPPPATAWYGEFCPEATAFLPIIGEAGPASSVSYISVTTISANGDVWGQPVPYWLSANETFVQGDSVWFKTQLDINAAVQASLGQLSATQLQYTVSAVDAYNNVVAEQTGYAALSTCPG